LALLRPLRDQEMSENISAPAPKRRFRIMRWLVMALGWIVLFVLTVWAVAALYFDVPSPALRTPVAAAFAVLMLLIVFFLKLRWRAAIVVASSFIAVLCWWFTLKPSSTRPWQPDVAQTAWAEVRGDEVTLHNVRN